MTKTKLPFSYNGKTEFDTPILINNRSGMTRKRKGLFLLFMNMMNGELEFYKEMLIAFLSVLSKEELALVIKYYGLTHKSSEDGQKKIPEFILIDSQDEAIVVTDALQLLEEAFINE